MPESRHTVLYTHGGGRLGNQVMRFIHWLSWLCEHSEIDFINMAFWPSAQFFSVWAENGGCVFPLQPHLVHTIAHIRSRLPPFIQNVARKNNRLQRLVHYSGGLFPGVQTIALDDNAEQSIDLEGMCFLQTILRSRLTICSGWKFGSWALVSRHQDYVRQLFAPAVCYRERSAAFISGIRCRHDLLIGVLIRHTDYRVWDSGQFFFSPQRYASWMKEVLDLYPSKSLGFLIASDERQDPNCFRGLNCYFATGNPGETGHWFDNWVELGMCDLVIGPPSTFSATAAFCGAIPLWPVTTESQVLAHGQLFENALIDAAKHPLFSHSVK